MEVARRIKEECCFVCPDLTKEFLKFDTDPSKYVKNLSYTESGTGKSVTVEVGHESFLGPEVFFSPEMAGSGNFSTPLPQLVDDVIQTCPIDCRRGLYGNIVLSGGSTMFKDFGKRLQRDMRTIVADRLAYTVGMEAVNKSSAPQVNVIAHSKQRYAVWCGGALFASMEQFPAYCHSKADYEEFGPGICRQSRVFGSLLG
jgi:actin-related protein 3